MSTEEDEQDSRELAQPEEARDEPEAESQQELDRFWPPPIEEIVPIVASPTGKTVSALAFNHLGSRFAAGGHDQQVKLWDFKALDKQRAESISTTQPAGQTIIKHLDFTNDDKLVLVVSGSCQAVIMARDGIVCKQYECPKGDQYISDMSNTRGHVQMLNAGSWNPTDKSSFITCSNDSTIRIWDLSQLSQQRTVIKARSPSTGLKAVPNACGFSRDALSIVAGCNDGSVMMWDTRRKFITTSACIRNAHLKGSEITGIEYAYGNDKLCTRSDDESCKVWDLRHLRQALATKTGLSTLYSTTDCAFSPDDKLVLTGSSSSKQEPGQVHFLDASDLTSKRSIQVEGASVVRVRWQPKINHIAYSCSNGLVHVAYDPRRSSDGFLLDDLATMRGTKRKKYISQREWAASHQIHKIITPHALPLFKEEPASASFAKMRQDPKRSYKPVMPATGASQGGYIKPAGSTLSSYIARNIAKPADDCGLNIRDRILRHADEARKRPMWINSFQEQSAPDAHTAAQARPTAQPDSSVQPKARGDQPLERQER